MQQLDLLTRYQENYGKHKQQQRPDQASII